MTGSEELSEEALVKVCRLLNQENVRYLVIGGYAMALHQVPRFTHDVDLLITGAFIGAWLPIND